MNTTQKITTKTLVAMALMIALSFVGSYLRIFGTIAFDSLPGFLSALLLGPIHGAAIGFLGHFFTALNAGFPLSFPLHMVIAVTMAITMFGFGMTYKMLTGRLAERLSERLYRRIPEAVAFIISGIVGIILNAPFSLACSIGALWIMAGREVALGLLMLLPALLLASVANITLAIIIFKYLRKVWNKIS